MMTLAKATEKLPAIEKARLLAEHSIKWSAEVKDVSISFTAKGYKVSFIHPLTGETHTVDTLLELEPKEWFHYLKTS